MPLRSLQHNLIKTRTPSSSIKQSLDPSHDYTVQEPDYLDRIDEVMTCANVVVETRSWGNPNLGSAGLSDNLESCSKDIDDNSKLLVCHDFKGGYAEDPFEQGYSFEFWHLVDTFIYFSHNRVTIPPRGWIDAGHRHGSKILGTVIFEWAESKPDLEVCLYGGTPPSVEETASRINSLDSFFCTTYASHLITLAQVRNFDGYLLNIETDLNFLPPAFFYPNSTQSERDEDAAFLEREGHLAGLGAFLSLEVQQRRAHRMEMNARALLGWVGWLREEGKRRVGPHWEVIWYDSVTMAGHLKWQDALTPANAPFFENSDAIFTNYTWARPPDPAPPGALPEAARFQIEHHPALRLSASMAELLGRPMSDVYIGIDVFGRNCYGGFDVGRSLEMIFLSLRRKSSDEIIAHEDTNLGLSVALFAPGWTWEREMEGGGQRTWNEWWEDELLFWIGTAGAAEEPRGSLDASAAPVSSFFGPRARSIQCVSQIPATPPPRLAVDTTKRQELNSSGPPIPFIVDKGSGQFLGFYTNFSRGSGTTWWVRGRKVYDAPMPAQNPAGRRGWTDIGSCFPKPDGIWPQPMGLRLHGGDQQEDTLVLSRDNNIFVSAALTDEDVWEGGNSLEVVFRVRSDPGPSSPAGSPARPSLIVLPLCTLNACHVTSYQSSEYSLSVVIKPLGLPAGVTTLSELKLRPHLIWTDTQPSGRGSYNLSDPHSEPNQAETHELDNGWYSITVVVCPKTPEIQAAARVPVAALGLDWPRSHAAHTDTTSLEFRLIVGAISCSALLPSIPSPSYIAGLNPHAADSVPQACSPDRSNNLNWKPVPHPGSASPSSLWGILTWGSQEGDEDDAQGLSGYFNVFALALETKKAPDDFGRVYKWQTDDVWLGTSTYESDFRSFVVAGLEPSDLGMGIFMERHTHSDALLSDTLDKCVEGEQLSFGSQWPSRVRFKVEWVGSASAGDHRIGERRAYECEVKTEGILI